MPSIRFSILLASAMALWASISAAPAAEQQTPASQPVTSRRAINRVAVDMLQKEATALEPLVETDWVKQFLRGTARLPAVDKRGLLKDDRKKTYFSRGEAGTLGAVYRASLLMMETGEIFYYYTKYGSPLAYARPLDIVGRHGFNNLPEKKILDFGYGTIGHLRLLATLGAQVVGVDIDPLLRALYSEEMDQGPMIGDAGLVGTVALLYGRFPADERLRKEVGTGYDLIISKNTLKNGYIHPAKPVDERLLVKLGASEEAFVKALYEAAKPGGLVMIYNICPAPSPPDKPYTPWSDGRCPFPKSMWQAAGFEILEFDKDDGPAIKKFAHALEWDKGEEPMDLEHDLFASYTLLKKPK